MSDARRNRAGDEGLFLASCLRVAPVAPVPHCAAIVLLELSRDFAQRSQIHLFHSLASHAQPLIVRTHVVCYHGCPVEVFLVGHHYMVQCGPTDGPHLPGIGLEQLPMEEEHREVRVGIFNAISLCMR